MGVYISAQGMEPVELADDESFTKVRQRFNKAVAGKIEFENAVMNGTKPDGKYDPFHGLTFATAEGGRISLNVDKIIGIYSDTSKD